MSNQIIYISNKNLQNLTGFVQLTPAASEQLQEIANVTVTTNGGSETAVSSGATTEATVAQLVSTIPVSVSFENQLVAAASHSTTFDSESNRNQTDGDAAGDYSENVSADEYSFQDDGDQDDSRRSKVSRAPSINLRYTGAKIPGRGFDGGVGKCIIYKDGVQRELTLQEVIDILANPDLSKLSTMPPIKPRGGSMYLYRCPDFETRHDLRSDHYLWCQQGTRKMPKEDPVVKRFYMYIRTEDPIKNVSKRPKKAYTQYDVRFKKCEYELINAEDPLVLVHYVGDETVWKPFRSRNTEVGPSYMRGIQGARIMPFDSGMITHLKVTEVIRSGTAPATGYEAVTTAREKEQIRNHLKFYNRSREPANMDLTTGLHSAKRSRLVESDSPMPAEVITMPDVSFEEASDAGVSSYTSRLQAAHAASTSLVPASELSRDRVISEVNAKYNRIWPTFKWCATRQMEGFIHSLSIVPQVTVAGASSYLLNVANDLAQLNSIQKADRMEFYYVSAGPIAGGYYLSTLLFRHYLFDTYPVVPLAFLVHERRSGADHRQLFECIKKKCPDIAASNGIFITDREYGNITSILPKAVQLYSWHYIEDDVANWVESNGGSAEESSNYLDDVLSLLKAKDVSTFHRELALKRRRWSPSFSSLFDLCLKADILSKGGRWHSDNLRCGIYDPFCGVVIPSCKYLNDLVGDLVAWHEASLEQILKCVHLFSEYYAREIERSMHQLGEFKLLSQFSNYARPPHRLRQFPNIKISSPGQIVRHVRGLIADI